MGTKDVEQPQEVKVEQNEKSVLKKDRPKADVEFERLKNEKFGTKENENADAAMLEWVELNRQLQIDRDTGRPYAVTSWDKTKGVFLDNPLVPLGLIATTMAISIGLFNFVKGSPNQNKWMRRRVGAQAFTIFAALGGAVVADRQRRAKATKNAVSTHNT